MAITEFDPKVLVEASKTGDEDAFSEIVRRFYEGLFAHALRRLGDAHAAEDAVQETLARAYRALPRFEGDFRLQAWLHRILTNVCHDEGARRVRETQAVDRLAGTRIDLTVDDEPVTPEVSRQEILDALAALPESYRQALVLRYVDDLPYQAVAEAAGVTEGNARLRVHRGRLALRRALVASLGALGWLVAVVRRAERTALAEVAGSGAPATTAAAVHASPGIGRVAESSILLADKVPSLASLLAVTATLVVPAAAPMAVERFSQYRDARHAPAAEAVAPEPDVDTVAVASAGSPVVADPPAAPSTTVTTAASAADDTTAGDEPGKPGAAAPTGEGPAEPEPEAALEPAPRLAAGIDAGDLRAMGRSRTELSGAVEVAVGEERLPGTLTGVLQFDEGDADGVQSQSQAEPEGSGSDGSEPEEGETSSSTTSTSTTTADDRSDDGRSASSPGGESTAGRRFTGELRISIEEGQQLRLVLTGQLVHLDDGSSRASGDYRLFDECGVELTASTFDGSLVLEEAPLQSSMALDFASFAPDADALRTACTPAEG